MLPLVAGQVYYIIRDKCWPKGFKTLNVIAIIPAFNEEHTVGRVVNKTLPFVNEVLVIDDGSSDATSKVAATAGANTVKHSINLGIGSSLRTGYNYCLSRSCDIVIQLDADGQHDPNFI